MQQRRPALPPPPGPPPVLPGILPPASEVGVCRWLGGWARRHLRDGLLPIHCFVAPARPAALQVVCTATLHELAKLPPRNISLDTEAAEAGEGGGGQVLTALELARQARIAANRAYLAGLGLGPKAMNTGQARGLALAAVRPSHCVLAAM